MIQTANFATGAKHPDAVAICRGVPRWYRGRRLIELAPERWLLNAHDPKLFDEVYSEQLHKLDPQHIAEVLGANAVMLCWEAFNVRCHRRMVAEWLESALGIEIPELGHDLAESLPYSKAPSKPVKPKKSKQGKLFPGTGNR